jgi:hypothetical protein
MAGMNDHGEPTTPSKARPRRWIIPAIIVVIVLVAGGIFAATVLSSAARDAVAEPVATDTAEPDTTPLPAETPTPTPAPTETAAAQPTDCYAIYGQEFLDTTGTEVLNDPSVAGTDISRYRPIEEIRETLPGIECHWGLATEGGVANAVNSVTAEQQQDVIGLLGDNDHICAEEFGGTVCRQSATFDEEGSTWTLAEEHFFREGLWVSTWWAGTASSISETTGPIYDTIWG